MPGQGLPRHAYDIAAAEAAELPITGGEWASIGPANIGGRVTDLALDPELSDTIYAAAASGGLWRSSDAGATFQSVWPDGVTQAMGAVAAAPDGTLYAGTGEANPGVAASRTRGPVSTGRPIAVRRGGMLDSATRAPSARS